MSKSIRTGTFNIDTNIGLLIEGLAREAYANWSVKFRMKLICNKIQNLDLDVIQIQEARKFKSKFNEEVDSYEVLVSFLESIGYSVEHQGYNPSARSFKYITAYKKDKFEFIDSKLKYLTLTPDAPTDHDNLSIDEIYKNNLGVEWERSTLIVNLKQLSTGREIAFFNVHLGIPEQHRLESTKLLHTIVDNTIKEKGNIGIFISGDFNTFPNSKGKEQKELMTEVELCDGTKLKDLTENLVLPNGSKVPNNSTFISFPYDFAAKASELKEETKALDLYKVPSERKEKIDEIFYNKCEAIGGWLDHVFVKGFEAKNNQAILDLANSFEPGPDEMDEHKVKNYLYEHRNEPAFASDHQPVWVELSGE